MAALGDRNPVARAQRLGLDGVLIVLAVSGSAWLVAHYLFGAGNEAIGLPHRSEVWWMRLHGLAGFAMLIVFGAFLPWHVPRGWRMQARRGVEITLLTLFASAIVTAYCLYYFAPDTIRPALGWVHVALGGGTGLAVAWHRSRRQRAGGSP
jgi:hypothetical protein